MPLDWTPLEISTLTDGARKVLAGPPAMKLMAAKGLAPLKPVELAVVLYHLVAGTEQPLRDAAEKSLADLPEKIIGPALADTGLDPRVLDLFANKVYTKPALVEVLLLNRSLSDQSVLELAPKLGEKELELVAVNEQRMLRLPAIIGALYMNPRARMSTVDRCVELAVRNQIVVPGVPRWDDVVAAVLGLRQSKGELQEVFTDDDAAFAAIAQVALGPDPLEFTAPNSDAEAGADGDDSAGDAEGQALIEKKRELPFDKLSVPAKMRLAAIGNAFARALLIRDSNKMVALAAVNSPGMTDNEIVKYSANRSLADDVIRVIASTKEWTKLYQVKCHLANNPKCPLPVAMRLLPFLHERDLRNLARSRGVASALTAQARKLLTQKANKS